MYFIEEKNVGLPAKFVLEEGKFQLVGGTNKVNDNVFMVLAFIGFFRVYCQDFVLPYLSLLQKPVSIILSMKTWLLSRMLRVFSKYVEYAIAGGINLIYDYKDKKDIQIVFEYTYKLDPQQNTKTVTYINI